MVSPIVFSMLCYLISVTDPDLGGQKKAHKNRKKGRNFKF